MFWFCFRLAFEGAADWVRLGWIVGSGFGTLGGYTLINALLLTLYPALVPHLLCSSPEYI